MADAFDYIESRDDADELIQEFGRLAGVRRVTASGAADEPTLTPADATTYAVRVEFTKLHRGKWNIAATDQRWLVAAGPLVGVDVKPGMFLVLGGVPLRMEKADELSPAGTVVLYDCQIKT